MPRAGVDGDGARDTGSASLGGSSASGAYAARADDGFALRDCRITNAVRCVPPENKPTPAEAAACRPFLAAEIAAMPRLEAVLHHRAGLQSIAERVAFAKQRFAAARE